MDDTSSVGGVAAHHDHSTDVEQSEPDVLLEVPQLRVEEITLDVEQLRAHVSVQANVLNLLGLSVGADVQLSGVHLEIKGVEAQALLKVRLDKIAEIIDRVMTTIDHNPEIIGEIVPSLDAAAGGLEQGARSAGDELASAVTAASSVSGKVGDTGDREATAGEPAGADGPEPEDTAAESGDEPPRRLLRRRKQARTNEEPPP